MARLFVRLALLCAVVSVSLSLSSACAVPKGGCKELFCKNLPNNMGVINGPAHNYSRPIGYYQGLWNDAQWPNKTKWNNVKNGPWVNMEIFSEVGTIVGNSAATTVGQCCLDCAKAPNCLMYHFFPSANKDKMASMPGFDKTIKCYFVKGGSEVPTANENSPVPTVPASGAHSLQVSNSYHYDVSFVGGLCNPLPSMTDDPHFVGARGTRFDFNGDIDHSFCILSDRRLHINAVLGGYRGLPNTTTTSDSYAPVKDLHTWMQEVGIVWVSDEGTRHKIHMVARKGKDQSRGSAGFISQMSIDNKVVSPPTVVGRSVSTKNGFVLTLQEQGSRGPMDQDTYLVTIPGLASIKMQVRAAHHLLQTPEQAFIHFNLQFNSLKTTPEVHGVLGQTYRETVDRKERALKYSQLSQLLHGPIAADGETGAGFLDGKVKDYISSGPVAADCAFSSLR